MRRLGGALLLVLGVLAAGTTWASAAQWDGAPGGAEPLTPEVGDHIPATELDQRQCPVPPEADDDVLRTLKQVADQRAASPKVRLAIFEAAWVESHANNLNCGDRDSLGVFQQRPSTGWGSSEQILDVNYATNAFLDGNPSDATDGAIGGAQRNHTWTAGQVAQHVQRSGFPDRYDESEAKARELIERSEQVDTDPVERGDLNWPAIADGTNHHVQARVAQHLLNEHGASLDVDGHFGPLTEDAVRSFQESNDLDIDGVIGPETWSKLVVDRGDGSTGEAVSAIQTALVAQGYNISIDGTYGQQTVDAVDQLTAYYELDPRGDVDAEIWRALIHVY